MGPGSKEEVWLTSKYNLCHGVTTISYGTAKSWFVPKTLCVKSFGVLLSPIQNVGEENDQYGNFWSIFPKVIVS